MTDMNLPSEIADQLKELEKAHGHYLTCTPEQRLWVLKNRSHMLYMPGTDPIAIRKQVQPAIEFLERNLALYKAFPAIFGAVKSLSFIEDHDILTEQTEQT